MEIKELTLEEVVELNEKTGIIFLGNNGTAHAEIDE